MRKAFGVCVVAVYWAVVVLSLRSASPVFMDGGGPMPSFDWGRMPFPTLGEYYGCKPYYDSLYWLPYLVAGFAVTMVGYAVTPPIRRRLRLCRSRPFVGAAGLTFVVLLLLASLSDAGVKLRIWEAPLFLLHSNFDWFCILVLTKILLPASILSGAVEAAGRTVPRIGPPR